MTTILLDALVPIFAGLALGFISGRRRLMDNSNVRNLIVLVMNFAIPCSLFSIIIATPRAALIEQLPTALLIAFALAAVYTAVFVWARRGLALSSSDASVLALTLGFPNATAVALSLLVAVYGSKAAIVAAISIAVGATTISPVTIAILESEQEAKGSGLTARKLITSFPRTLKRPVVWAPLLALLGVFVGFHLPSYLQRTLSIVGSAAAGSALILTGLVLSSQTFRWSVPILAATVVKCIVQPALALSIALLLHMDHNAVKAITTVCAIPAGFFGMVFGKGFNATPGTAASALITSYAIAPVTLPLWILLLNRYV